MARVYARPVGLQALQQLPMLQKQLWSEGTINKGMISSIDPADIPEGALSLAKNARVRFDVTSRRYGYSNLGPADSDANIALKVHTFKLNSGAGYIVKLRPNGPKYTDLSSWFTPAGTALLGTANDRFSVCVAQNKFIFSNNGVDFVQALDTVGNTFAPLGNDTESKIKARYVTSFYNRVVIANYTDPAVGTPVTLGWSGDSAPTEFNVLDDPSAGSSPLIDSPGDEADFITGIFGFTNVMVVIRERSIWLASKQPVASNPFYFFGAVPGIGSNCPYAIDVMTNAIVFTDVFTGSVWVYDVGRAAEKDVNPARIGLPIEKTLIAAISDPTQVFGSYSPANHEYSVGIVQSGTNIRKVWTFSFRNKAWCYEEIPDLYDIHDSSIVGTTLSVGQLAGIVSGLAGTVANLSNAKATSTSRIITTTPSGGNNVIKKEDSSSDIDVEGAFATEIQSKDFVFPDIDVYVSEIRIEYIAHKGGSFILGYSRDSGNTWVDAKTFVINELEVPLLARLIRQIKSRRIRWRITSSSGLFDLLSYEVHVYAAGESRK